MRQLPPVKLIFPDGEELGRERIGRETRAIMMQNVLASWIGTLEKFGYPREEAAAAAKEFVCLTPASR